jgi:hypothetical protein
MEGGQNGVAAYPLTFFIVGEGRTGWQPTPLHYSYRGDM